MHKKCVYKHTFVMKTSGIISYVLVAVGAILWLLIGLFDFDLIARIWSYSAIIARYVCVGIGLGGLFFIFVSIAFRPLKGL